MIQEYDRLPEELLDICKNTFKTHLGIEGHTGKGLERLSADTYKEQNE